MANRAIKYRIYPTTEQCEMFTKTFGCCRKIWNLMQPSKTAFCPQARVPALSGASRYDC